MDIESVKSHLSQYLALKKEADFVAERVLELKKRLTEDVEAYGETTDRGHVVLEVGDSTLTKQRKVIKNLDINIAEDLLAEKGIKEKCIVMIPTLDEAAIMAAFYEGQLTEEDIDTMFPSKVSYAFLVK